MDNTLLNKFFKNNKICKVLEIELPIIQAGMVWVSGSKLASASANNGILGIIGAGSMDLATLKHHLKKAKQLSGDNFSKIAVNIPLLYSKSREQIDLCMDNGITTFFTSAGSPSKYSKYILDNKCKFIHVVSTPCHAKKAEDAGAIAVVAEGFEAGGHNGIDEITTMCLIPQVKKCVNIPIIAAGGIASAESILASIILGADAVQIGTLFVSAIESSAHDNFKNEIIKSKYDSTKLVMKQLTPVRLLKNDFYQKVIDLEKQNASNDEMKELLGKGRARKGMLEGNLLDGELEIGQICSSINTIQSVKSIIVNLRNDLEEKLKLLQLQ